jgi:hypothetical protein
MPLAKEQRNVFSKLPMRRGVVIVSASETEHAGSNFSSDQGDQVGGFLPIGRFFILCKCFENYRGSPIFLLSEKMVRQF